MPGSHFTDEKPEAGGLRGIVVVAGHERGLTVAKLQGRLTSRAAQGGSHPTNHSRPGARPFHAAALQTSLDLPTDPNPTPRLQ